MTDLRHPNEPDRSDPPRDAIASGWGLLKTAVSALSTPVSVPLVAAAAMRTTHITAERIERFPDHLRAIADGEPAPLPAPRTLRRDASRRYLITSDLHRCIPGRLDWPERQGVKHLYAEVLAAYGAEGWDLIENGDVEDFWMVGGSASGTRYDLASLGAGVASTLRAGPRRRVLGDQLDRIVDNNAEIYATIHEYFLGDGRYHRTMGNHDDVFGDVALIERLDRHLPGVKIADTILLVSSDEPGLDSVDAVVTHGHLTDSWNGPGFSSLGRSVTWLGGGIDDLPGVPPMESLPDERIVEQLITVGTSNRLIEVDPRFGGNRRFDSLDEVRLFEALAADGPSADGGATDSGGVWPWLVFGHTHFPVLEPLDGSGEPVRYANSGSGVLSGAFTALEWDVSNPDRPIRLVCWVDGPDGPRRVELVPDGSRLTPV